jgi:hypothetical protein
MDEVEKLVTASPAFRVARCDSPDDLIDIVAGDAQARGKIDILDFYDHGSIGGMLLGDDVLFHSDGNQYSQLVNEDIARSLSEFLSETAHVRLLGCSTAAADGPSLEARLLLLKLSNALGAHRVAFGTIEPVVVDDFGSYGLRRDVEIAKLYSSLSAIDFEPPSPTLRGRSIDATRLKALT